MAKILSIIFFGLFLNLQPVLAHIGVNSNLPNVPSWEVDEALLKLSPIRFLPDHPLYFFITLKEKFDHITKPDKATKALFDINLTGKRIKESYQLVQKNKLTEAKSSLKSYQEVSLQLRSELTEAASQGLPVFEVEKTMADSLERQLKIILVLAQKGTDEDFEEELANSVESIKLSAKLLEKHLPDAAERILNFADKIQIIP